MRCNFNWSQVTTFGHTVNNSTTITCFCPEVTCWYCQQVSAGVWFESSATCCQYRKTRMYLILACAESCSKTTVCRRPVGLEIKCGQRAFVWGCSHPDWIQQWGNCKFKKSHYSSERPPGRLKLKKSSLTLNLSGFILNSVPRRN